MSRYTREQLIALAAADAKKYGLGDWFVNQIQDESGFDPNAKSGAGAEGIAQFIPSTAKGVGLADPYNPVAALDAAARFDRQLVDRYGSVPRALSAYNSGRPDAYQDPSFAGGQTFNYVRKILGSSPEANPAGAPGKTVSPIAAAAAASQDYLAPARAALRQHVATGGLDLSGFYQALGTALRKRNAAQAPAGMPVQFAPAAPSPGANNLKLQAVPLGLATRAGIQLDAAVLPTADQIAQRFGVRINSGYRSPQHNAAVGGAAGSDHLTGDAVDYTGAPSQLAALYAWAQRQKFPYLEPMGQSRDHVHISLARR